MKKQLSECHGGVNCTDFHDLKKKTYLFAVRLDERTPWTFPSTTPSGGLFVVFWLSPLFGLTAVCFILTMVKFSFSDQKKWFHRVSVLLN